MRRTLAAVVLVISTLVAAPAGARHERPVSGTGTGSGVFTPYPTVDCGAIASQTSSGTIKIRALGRGTYLFQACLTDDYTQLVRFVFTDRRGDELVATFASPASPYPFPLEITGGTGRFAGATGTLRISTARSNETNCYPQVQICFNWDETVTVEGELRLQHGRRSA